MIEKTLKNAEMGRKKIKLKQITFKYLQASKHKNNYKVPYIPLQLFFTTNPMAYTQAFADFALKQEDKLIGKLAKLYGFDAEEAKERLSPKTEEQRSEELRLRKEKQQDKRCSLVRCDGKSLWHERREHRKLFWPRSLRSGVYHYAASRHLAANQGRSACTYEGAHL